MQFGFVGSRGTAMAAALTHDVLDYCVSNGSPVYVCSLDAEGAFDSIPHSILFKKAMCVIPTMYWRILLYWYARLVVQIKWGNELSGIIHIWKGTRQGGLSSPFLFNLLYQDMMSELSNMTCGISVNGITYNACCYADDVLLCSVTISGLQMLIDTANSYITRHGLSFNPAKTQCMTFGKSNFSGRAWRLDGIQLDETDSIVYLGVTLTNDTTSHAAERIKAARRAFFALQGAGMCVNGLNPDTIVHLYNTAIRPVLMYGLQCVYQNKTAMEGTEKIQGKLLKSALGLKNTPLLDALKIPRIAKSVEVQELLLFRTMFMSNSRTCHFYQYLLSRHLNGYALSKKCMLSRVMRTCHKYDISVIKLICDSKYALLIHCAIF
jgi:hypothetical protein